MSDKQKKDFGETKFGKFISKVKDINIDGSAIGSAVAQATTGNFVGAIASIGKSLVGSNHEKSQQLMEELVMHQESYLKELELVYKDKESARDMQKQALLQNDIFSKRFIYYFAFAIFTFSALVITLLFFVEIPSDNQRIIDMAIGILLGTGLVGIIQFFYGSSKSSEDKTNIIDKMNNK